MQKYEWVAGTRNDIVHTKAVDNFGVMLPGFGHDDLLCFPLAGANSNSEPLQAAMVCRAMNESVFLRTCQEAHVDRYRAVWLAWQRRGAPADFLWRPHVSGSARSMGAGQADGTPPSPPPPNVATTLDPGSLIDELRVTRGTHESKCLHIKMASRFSEVSGLVRTIRCRPGPRLEPRDAHTRCVLRSAGKPTD